MAERLAKIFGTEEDKVNCPFYFKIGACRHGETCTRIHNKPPVSQTMVFPHLYDNPPAAIAFADGLNVPQESLVEAVNHFEDFYEEVFSELAKFGELEEVVVADNIGEHMIGNVYVKYQSEDQAHAAMQGLLGRYYAGKVIMAEFSPVTDFREAKCRQYNEGACDRGGYCNFMHPKHVSRDLKRTLFK
jgi:splicing factor U2AF subunit